MYSGSNLPLTVLSFLERKSNFGLNYADLLDKIIIAIRSIKADQ